MFWIAAFLVVQSVAPLSPQTGAIIRDSDSPVSEGTAVLNENVRERADRCERDIITPTETLSDECQMFLEGFNRAMRSSRERPNAPR